MNNNLSHTQTGTPFYASPEVWENKPYDYKCDIWSLGCLFYELVTLNPPFHGKSLNEIYNNIKKCNLAEIPYFYNKEFKKIIDLCLKIDSNLTSMLNSFGKFFIIRAIRMSPPLEDLYQGFVLAIIILIYGG